MTVSLARVMYRKDLQQVMLRVRIFAEQMHRALRLVDTKQVEPVTTTPREATFQSM